MALLPIYTFGQPVLRKKAKAVRDTEGLAKFAEDMFETMRNANGIGLAANQVGSLQRVIVIDVSEMEEAQESEPLVLINPKVVNELGKSVLEEGCLSIPDVRDEVQRPEQITVRFHDVNLEEQEMEAEGLLARVILHEIDHLNGVLFIDRLSAIKRKLLRGRLNKIQRGEIEVKYPVVTAEGVGIAAK